MRPKLVAPSVETLRLSEELSKELLTWPGVRMRPMFGLRAFYRGSAVFAMLPGKRALENHRAIGYKIGGKWELFEFSNLSIAMLHLEKAYRKSG